jgi:hypothetical protein
MSGLRSGLVNAETLLFAVRDHQLTDKEEKALVEFVRPAHNLGTLTHRYTTPPFVPASPHQPEVRIKTSDDDEVDIDDAHANQNSGRSINTTHTQSADADEDTEEGNCCFSLARLLGTCNETLRNLSLIQGIRQSLNEQGLLIGEKCPQLIDLAITSSAIEHAVLEDSIELDLAQQLELLAEILKTF